MGQDRARDEEKAREQQIRELKARRRDYEQKKSKDTRAPRRERAEDMDEKMFKLLKETQYCPGGSWGRDTHSKFLNNVKNVKQVQVWRIEIPLLRSSYEELKSTMRKGCTKIDVGPHEILDPDVNEVYLWHGTKKETAEKYIRVDGFEERVCDMAGNFGAGVYFAEDCDKSGQYAPEPRGSTAHHFFYSRVLLGEAYTATARMPGIRNPPEYPGHRGKLYDSVISQRGTTDCYREFVVYDRLQAYPEFEVIVTA